MVHAALIDLLCALETLVEAHNRLRDRLRQGLVPSPAALDVDAEVSRRLVASLNTLKFALMDVSADVQ